MGRLQYSHNNLTFARALTSSTPHEDTGHTRVAPNAHPALKAPHEADYLTSTTCTKDLYHGVHRASLGIRRECAEKKLCPSGHDVDRGEPEKNGFRARAARSAGGPGPFDRNGSGGRHHVPTAAAGVTWAERGEPRGGKRRFVDISRPFAQLKDMIKRARLHAPQGADVKHPSSTAHLASSDPASGSEKGNRPQTASAGRGHVERRSPTACGRPPGPVAGKMHDRRDLSDNFLKPFSRRDLSVAGISQKTFQRHHPERPHGRASEQGYASHSLGTTRFLP